VIADESNVRPSFETGGAKVSERKYQVKEAYGPELVAFPTAFRATTCPLCGTSATDFRESGYALSVTRYIPT